MADDNDDQNNGDSPNFAQLRKRAEDAEARATAAEAKVATYRDTAVKNAALLAGFQTNDDGTFQGPAALLVKEFSTSLGEDDIPTRDAFLALATQYGVEPQAAATVTTEQPSAAAQLGQLQSVGDQIRAAAQAAEPVGDLPTQIASLEAAGKWTEAGRLKRQLQTAGA